MQQTTVIEISIKSIIRIVAVILGIILVWMVSDILFSIVVAIIIASAIEPWVGKLQTKGIPRSISVLLTYLVALGIVALAIGSIIPPLASEVSQLVKDFPEKYKGFIDFFKNIGSKIRAVAGFLGRPFGNRAGDRADYIRHSGRFSDIALFAL